MSLLANHDDALFECISSALDRAALMLPRENEVRRTIDALLRLAHQAIAAFSERWNTRTGNRLPPEVLSACFHWLSFRDRIRASHVSQHWRCVALSTPALWSHFRCSGDENKLVELLRRSQAVPLTLDASSMAPSQELILRRHAGRIRALKCRTLMTDLDAPCLRNLEVLWSHSRAVLSQETIGPSSDSLQTMTLDGKFTVSPMCPRLTNLREFSAVFGTSANLSEVLALCPSLRKLTVRCDYLLGVDPRHLFIPLPPSLSDLSVTGMTRRTLDYSAFTAWSGHRFHNLELGYLSDITGVLTLFTASLPAADSEWSLEISLDESDFCYRLSTASARTCIELSEQLSAGRVASDLLLHRAHLHHLTALKLSLSFFAACITAGIELPALTAFTLAAQSEDDSEMSVDDYATEFGSGMRVPLLHSFTFAWRPGWSLHRRALEWFVRTLPKFLAVWMRYDADVLETLTLVGRITPRELEKVDFHKSAVHAIAQTVHVENSAQRPP
ncbi:hypothetical protein AURDEDRAFT_166148 [Auricularia subglabra TFB-10046 SS5]|nr:hypothetical protein AURDEDRAFT_166148 [Auricularia subglabra TFB-10046 SS5]